MEDALPTHACSTAPLLSTQGEGMGACSATTCCTPDPAAQALRPRRFVGRRKEALLDEHGKPKDVSKGPRVFSRRVASHIPDEIVNDPKLQAAVSMLPSNYSFEVFKSVHRLRRDKVKRVALQLPEGLQMFACTLATIFEEFAGVDSVILGDVTYGACCVDDYTAAALGCDFMIHYGHSCLVPVSHSKIPMQYVFVHIKIDIAHFISTVKHNFDEGKRVLLVSTIQFAPALQEAKSALASHLKVTLSQEKPLSPGEILGCTSPTLDPDSFDAVIYLGDGRFHLESVMIANPTLPAYRYDPYSKVFSREHYDFEKMHAIRRQAIATAQKAKRVGVILGTLGRQGNPRIVKHIEDNLDKSGKAHTLVLLSEIFPWKLDLFKDIDAWVQVACPRLSIDWGAAFSVPLLNPYEAEIAFGEQAWRGVYAMDYYSKDGGQWSNRYLG